jgi:hypothetical protein
MLGIADTNKYSRIVKADHTCSGAEDCDVVLHKNSRRLLLRLNRILAAISLCFALLLIFTLQAGIKT